jgi:ComF family protein
MPSAVLLLKALSPLAPPGCFGCGASATGTGPLCAACRRRLAWLPHATVWLVDADGAQMEAWAPLAYRGGAQAVVRALKFRGAVAVADVMAAQVAATAPPHVLATDALVPVPVHRSRRRRRGFNQAERLARALARRTGTRVVDCLERRGAPKTQMGRDRDARLRALEDAIALRPGAKPPRNAVLVDDVLTTGATALACARALRAGGAERVVALAYARTPGR